MIGFIREEEVVLQTPELKEGVDFSIYGKGMVFPAREENGDGYNTLVIGSTRSGKTTSVLLPSVLHSFQQSLVIPYVKDKIYEQCVPLLKKRGYTIISLDFTSAEKGTYGYDPMAFISKEDEYLSLAENLVGGTSKTIFHETDRYWSDACVSCIAAMIMLSRYLNGKKSGFADFLQLYGTLEVSYPGGHCTTSLDMDFERMSYDRPNSSAPKLWSQLQGNASRTAACIISMIHSALSKYMGDWLFLFKKKRLFDPKILGRQKTACFIHTNTVSIPGRELTNMLFGDIIKHLFEEAESLGGRLSIPVSIYFDDFAAGSRIEHMADYMSTFCASGISATILLQSRSQLNAIYGEYESTTILNNCKNLVYLGSNDIVTVREMSERTGFPMSEIFSMKPGKEIFASLGMGAKMLDRYDTFSDPLYLSVDLEKGT